MEVNPPVKSDYDLALQIACGDDEAFRAFIRQHGPIVLGYLNKRFPHIADDAWQDALIRLMERINHYDPQEGPLGPWFLRLAQRCALTIIRAERKHGHKKVPDEVDWDRRNPLVERPTAKQQKRMEHRVQQIREAIATLPSKERRVAEADLAFWKGPTYPDEVAPAEQLAEEWGDTTANAIHQARYRARKKLREELTKRLGTEGTQL